MFVVGTVRRVAKTDDSGQFDLSWPVQFEDETQGFVSGTVATRPSREAAENLATALNTALNNAVEAN